MAAIARHGLGDAEAIQARSIRLSGVVREHGPIDLVKLDIEGAEYEVLRDPEETGTIRDVRELVIKWQEGTCPAPIGDGLSLLDRNGFRYRLMADWKPWYRMEQPCIVTIHATRPAPGQAAATNEKGAQLE